MAAVQVLEELEAELQVSQERCNVIERAIRSLREIYGIHEGAPAPLETSARKAKDATRTERTNERAKRTPAVQRRGFDDDAELGDRIVAAIKKAAAPIRSGAAGAAVKLNGGALTRLLVRLEDAKRIIRHGTGRGAVVMLPGMRAKERL